MVMNRLQKLLILCATFLILNTGAAIIKLASRIIKNILTKILNKLFKLASIGHCNLAHILIVIVYIFYQNHLLVHGGGGGGRRKGYYNNKYDLSL